jgi:heme-degrading monooxygenase HmoA
VTASGQIAPESDPTGSTDKVNWAGQHGGKRISCRSSAGSFATRANVPNVTATWSTPPPPYARPMTQTSNGPAILRIWRGKTLPERADDYAEYIAGTGLPGYLQTPGNTSAAFTRRDLEGTVEFCMVTTWTDMDAVKAFAGPNPEVAVFYPEDDDYLVDRELTVSHYEIFATG